jgi:phosphocarrier protein HPr
MAEVERRVTIINELGLHARAASKLVSLANKFTTIELKIAREDMMVNAKSIMGVLMLAASKGTDLTLIAVGPEADATGALDAIVALINDRFGEER